MTDALFLSSGKFHQSAGKNILYKSIVSFRNGIEKHFSYFFHFVQN